VANQAQKTVGTGQWVSGSESCSPVIEKRIYVNLLPIAYADVMRAFVALPRGSQSRELSASTSSHQQRTAHSTFDSSKRRQCRRKYRDAAKVFAALPCASCRMAWLLCKQLPHVPRSCHHVFDHRTKGVCLEGLSGERTKSAPVLLLLLHAHMHMHGAEWTVPGQTTACGRAW